MGKLYTLILTLAALTASAENSLDKPLAMPFYENFAGGKYDHEGWEVIPVSGETATLSLTDHDPVTGLVSYVDRDKGLLVINNDKAGSFYLMSPYIKVGATQTQCELSEASFVPNSIKAESVMSIDGSEIAAKGDFDLYSYASMNPEWTEMSTNGSPAFGTYVNKVVRFGWKITTDGQGGTLCLDKIKFSTEKAYDFALINPHATPRVKPGEEVTLSVDAACKGKYTSLNYSVTATVDGQELPEKFVPQENITGTKYGTGIFKFRVPDDMKPGTKNVKFELSFRGDWAGSKDQELSNNVAYATFDVLPAFLPGASNFKADDNGVLTWDCMSDGSRITDTMESLASYDDGSIDAVYELHPYLDYDVLVRSYGDRGVIGSYVVYDKDQRPTIAADSWVENCVPNIFHLMSCTVADFTVPADELAADSGNKALLFWSNEDGTPCDNYLVLPELNSSDLTLKFKARAYSADYPESLEILASSTDGEVSSFSVVKTLSIDGNEYEEYEVTLPDDTKFAALRHVSDEGYALLVDDLSFSAKAREILGYNVYHYGNRVNSELLADKRFATNRDGRYTVTVVYPEGESEPTGDILIGVDGVSSVVADVTGDTPVYYNLQGQRVANPEGGVFIEVAGGSSRKVIK